MSSFPSRQEDRFFTDLARRIAINPSLPVILSGDSIISLNEKSARYCSEVANALTAMSPSKELVIGKISNWFEIDSGTHYRRIELKCGPRTINFDLAAVNFPDAEK